MDAKVAVKVGEFDRGGKTRVTTVALRELQRMIDPIITGKSSE